MRRFLGLALAEWRLEWRPPGLWAGVALLGAYGVAAAGRAATYLEAAVRIGSWMTIILPLVMSLVWVAAARRSSRYTAAEMADASPCPASWRTAAEMLGGLAVALAAAVLVALASAATFALWPASGPGLRGLPGDLVLIGLLAVPVLPAWAALSRVIGTSLSTSLAYVATVALWLPGIWLPLSVSRYTLTFTPLANAASELTMLAPEVASTLLQHRLVVAGVGTLACLGVILHAGGVRRVGDLPFRMTLSAVTAVLLLAALAALPGALRLTPAATLTGMTERPVVAASSPRWTESWIGDDRAFLSWAHSPWAEETVTTLRAILEEGRPREFTLVAVEAPQAMMTLTDDGGVATVLVPEGVFDAGDMAPRPGLAARHIITRYVQYATEPETCSGAAASAGAGSEYPPVGSGADAVDGIRLVSEWAYVERILGEELARDEIAGWRLWWERLDMRPGDAAGGSPGPGLLPVDGLWYWRGGQPGVSSYTLDVAFAVYEAIGRAADPEALLATCRILAASADLDTLGDPSQVALFFAELYESLGASPVEDDAP